MGDTPSLLYMMDGNPHNPYKESWGGNFKRISYSSHIVFDRETSAQDTVPVYSLIEFRIKGPVVDIPADSICLTLTIGKQNWGGYYLGNGIYAVRTLNLLFGHPALYHCLGYSRFSEPERRNNHRKYMAGKKKCHRLPPRQKLVYRPWGRSAL